MRGRFLQGWKSHFLLLAAAVLLVLVASAAQAEPILEDPEGDVRIGTLAGDSTSPYPWAPVDLRAIAVVETEHQFLWTVQVTGLAEEQGGSCPDSGDLRSFFTYGEHQFNIQQGISFECKPYGFLTQTFASEFDRTFLSALNVTAGADSVTVEVPKALIRDSAGAPPIAGRRLTDIYALSFNMASIGGPADPTDFSNQDQADWLVVSDDMGLEAPAEIRIELGGIDSEGPVRLHSEDPFRASNGGNGIYAWALELANDANTAKTFVVTVEGAPDDWERTGPQEVTVRGGEVEEVVVAVETPFGHQHGGTDAFLVRAEAEDAWATVDLGIHYLDIPQPAGHHPDLFLHGEPIQNNFMVSVFNGADGVFSMNTTADTFPGEQAIQGYHAEGVGGARIGWSACLQDSLKLGLQQDMTRTGSLVVAFEATRPYTGASVAGRLLHLPPGEAIRFCAPFFYAGHENSVVATLPSVELGDIQGATSAELEVLPEVEQIPYQAGATLILELWVEHGGADAGPSQLTLAPGARLNLPLLEYETDRPVGLIGGGEEAPVLEELPPDIEETASEESPGFAFAAGLGGLAASAVAVRARTRIR